MRRVLLGNERKMSTVHGKKQICEFHRLRSGFMNHGIENFPIKLIEDLRVFIWPCRPEVPNAIGF